MPIPEQYAVTFKLVLESTAVYLAQSQPYPAAGAKFSQRLWFQDDDGDMITVYNDDVSLFASKGFKLHVEFTVSLNFDLAHSVVSSADDDMGPLAMETNTSAIALKRKGTDPHRSTTAKKP